MEKIHKWGTVMTDKPRRPDRRIAKTKRAIKKAFVKLLLIKDYNKITIKDIANEADVDRKTVYNYYKGIYEIRDEIENELVHSMEQLIEQFDYKDTRAHTKQLFNALTQLINQNNDLFNYLFKNDSNSKMIRKIIFFVKDTSYKLLSESSLGYLGHDKLDIISSFISGGAVITYQNWFISNKRTSLNELSDTLSNFVFTTIEPYRQHDK